MPPLSIKVLGPLVVDDRRAATHKLPKKALGLIAYLAVEKTTVPRRKLADLLWPYQDQNGALHSLRNCLMTVRQIFGPEAITTTFTHCQLEAKTDRERFKALSWSGVADDWQAALELYRGDFLDGLVISSEPWEEWVAQQRAECRESALSTAMRLAECYLGSVDAAVNRKASQAAKLAISLDPLEERAHRLLIRSHIAMDQRSAAVRQYKNCEELLRRELHIDPDDATRSLVGLAPAKAMPARVALEERSDVRAACKALADEADREIAGVNGAKPGTRVYLKMAALLRRIERGEAPAHLSAVA